MQARSLLVEGDSHFVLKVKAAQPDAPIRGGGQCKTLPDFQAAFLVQEADRDNSYMFLDPIRVPWFFTRPLGGCEMFVAKGSTHHDVLITDSD